MILTSLVLVVSLACGMTPATQKAPTNPPPPTNPPAPTNPPPPTPTRVPQSGDLLYYTTFNDLGMWTAYSRDDFSEYTVEGRDNGLYFIVPSDRDYLYIYYDGLTAEDVRIEADVELTGGTNYTYFNLICRSSDAGEYYFIMDAGGLWQIGKYSNGEYTRLTEGGNTAIRVAKAPNHLTGICEGSELTFLINGTEVGSVVDYDLTSGLVGIAVETFDYARAEGFYHTFEVYVP